MPNDSANPQMAALLQTWRMADSPAPAAAPAKNSADVVAVVQLADVLDLKAAPPLANELLSLRGRAVQVDASRVRRVGGLCLQVLLSTGRTWRTDGVPLSIVNPSTHFVEGLALLGAPAALPLQA